MTVAGAADTARIGIDLGGTKISGIVLAPEADGALEAHCHQRVPTPRGSYPATVAAICELVETLSRDWRARNGHAAGERLPVGIGTPGSSAPDSGRMSNCNSTWLNGQCLQQDLQTQLQRPVALANDADCFALAQSILQAGGGAEPVGLLFGVILGTGVGGGWVAHGQPRQGPNRLSGEWGHTPLPYLRSANARQEPPLAALESRLEDRLCYCGRLNCIETFLSGPGVAATHRSLWGGAAQELDATEIFASGTSWCLQTSQLYCDMLARSLAQVVNVIDPELIVLGGGLSNVALLYDALPQRIPAYLFDRSALRTAIKPPISGADSGVVGAALLCGRDALER